MDLGKVCDMFTVYQFLRSVGEEVACKPAK
jgi:hypothetical protein